MTPWTVSPPGSSVREILQARILEWVAIPFPRGPSQPSSRTPGLLDCRQMLYRLGHQGSRITRWADAQGSQLGRPLQRQKLATGLRRRRLMLHRKFCAASEGGSALEFDNFNTLKPKQSVRASLGSFLMLHHQDVSFAGVQIPS